MSSESKTKTEIVVKPLEEMNFISRGSGGNYLNIPSDLRKALVKQEI